MLWSKQKHQFLLWVRTLRAGLLATQWLRQYGLALLLAGTFAAGAVGTASATTTSKSSNYSVTETQFGGGSQTHQCSTSYCAKSSAGDTSVGSGTSTNYSAQFGANTTDIPLLQVITANTTHALGVLDETKTGSGTTDLSIKHYLMAGYAVELTGSSPSQGVHAIHALSTPDISRQGTEQFGINLVANTAPAIGTNPAFVPSGASATDYVELDYKQPDYFKYAPGDIIAENYSQSGEIAYTLSMIFNVSNVTPGGQYKGNISAVVVPLF